MINGVRVWLPSPRSWMSGWLCPLVGGQVQLPKQLKVIGGPAFFKIGFDRGFVLFLSEPVFPTWATKRPARIKPGEFILNKGVAWSVNLDFFKKASHLVGPRWRVVFCHLGLPVSFTRSVRSNQEVSHPGKKITLLLQTPSRGGSRCFGFSPEPAEHIYTP